MFNLEKQICAWRKQMLAAGIKFPVPLEELEIHLREEIERQIKSGLNELEAFQAAIQQIGHAAALKSEFAKAERTKGIVLRGLKIFSIIAFSAVVVGLNIYLASELKAICLIDFILLSFVLPFMAGSQISKNAADSKRRSRTVWAGLLLMGPCSLLINFPSHPVFGLIAAAGICVGFALTLRRQARATVARS